MSHRPTSRSRRRAAVTTALAALVPLALAAGCSSQASGGETTKDGKVAIPLWTHSAGSETEMAVLNQIIDDFNASQDTYEVQEQEFPQEAYNDSVQGAAAANDLPCVLDVDGPIMPNWAWNGWMVPTGLTDADVADFLPSTVGRYNDEIYSVGYWDATTVMFTRKSILDEHGIRVPTVDEPWTADEYAALQQKIADSGDFKNVVDYGPSWTGEWWSYGFGTFLTSFGGDEIDRDGFDERRRGAQRSRVAGVRDVVPGPVRRRLRRQVQLPGPHRVPRGEGRHPVQRQLGVRQERREVRRRPGHRPGTPTSATARSAAPAPGSTASPRAARRRSWPAGWSTSSSPWTTSTSRCTPTPPRSSPRPAPQASRPPRATTGPVSRSRSSAQIAQKYAQVRPETPAYPVISQVFEKQLQDIMNGKDPQEGLDQMVSEIDADLASAGYDN